MSLPSPLVSASVCVKRLYRYYVYVESHTNSSKSVEELAHQWVSNKKTLLALVSPRKDESSVPKAVRISKPHSFRPVCPYWSDGHGVPVHTTLQISSSRKGKPTVHSPNSAC